jgi:hypothetical protein
VKAPAGFQELADEAEDLVWKVVDAQPNRSGLRAHDWYPSETKWRLFLQGTQVPGRFRHDPMPVRGNAFRCYFAGSEVSRQVWTRGTSSTGLVALAAKVGPEGPFAGEILALAATMLMAGLTVAEETS